jgi:hypothetical protein
MHFSSSKIFSVVPMAGLMFWTADESRVMDDFLFLMIG